MPSALKNPKTRLNCYWEWRSKKYQPLLNCGWHSHDWNRIQTHNPQSTLNKARKALPLEKSIWMAAAKLEESQNHLSRVPKIVDKAFKSLAKKKEVSISTNQWIAEAESCEQAGSVCTSAAIIVK